MILIVLVGVKVFVGSTVGVFVLEGVNVGKGVIVGLKTLPDKQERRKKNMKILHREIFFITKLL
jgi:hypothetical protein